MERTCYIVGAAHSTELEISPTQKDLVIAADGGYLNLIKKGIRPDVIIGDFDSSPLPTVNDIELIKLKPEKDFTDTAEAVMLGRKKGYKNFAIYGGLGGERLSHTIANLALATDMSRQGLSVCLFGDDIKIRIVTNEAVSIAKGCKYLSVFACSEKATVTLSGVKYPLNDYTLQARIPLGVSNEIISDCASIAVKDGTVIIIEEF